MLYNGEPSSGTCVSRPTLSDNIQLSDLNYGSNRTYSGSTISNYLTTWFFENLIEYEPYLEDTSYCNSNTYSSGDVSLDCSDENKVSVANGKSNYPIGLLTAQEANLCGTTGTGTSNYSWVLAEHKYWTMSGSSSASNFAWAVCSNNISNNYNVGYGVANGVAVRPVISLNSSVELNVGTGKYNDPYIVSTN